MDLKARRLSLESSSHWLVDFPYHKLDEVEVPGQYFKVSWPRKLLLSEQFRD